MSFKRKQQAPETIVENYKIGKVMGKGAFGKVNLANLLHLNQSTNSL